MGSTVHWHYKNNSSPHHRNAQLGANAWEGAAIFERLMQRSTVFRCP
jgi:hypothetical protein